MYLVAKGLKFNEQVEYRSKKNILVTVEFFLKKIIESFVSVKSIVPSKTRICQVQQIVKDKIYLYSSKMKIPKSTSKKEPGTMIDNRHLDTVYYKIYLAVQIF